MRKLTLAAAALLVVALAAPSFAGIDEGDWEVSLRGNAFISDFHTNWGGDITLGYFVTPEIEVGAWFGYHRQKLDGDVNENGHDVFRLDFKKTTYDFAAFGAYYFPTDAEWMPYIGGFVGYEYGKLDGGGDLDFLTFKRDGLELGAFVGIKYFVAEKATIFIEYRFTWRNEDKWKWSDDHSVTIDDNEVAHLIQIGLSILF